MKAENRSIHKASWVGKKIYYYEEIDSTNMEAKRKAKEGAVSGTVIAADMQSAGKGRRGRSWSSPLGEGIFFSILLKPDILPENAPMITLIKAMAVVRGIERVTGLKPQIKWPNDVVLSQKKLVGILTEMSIQKNSIDYIVVGTGINVHQKEFPKEIADTATSLDLELAQRKAQRTADMPDLSETGKESGEGVSRRELLEAVLGEFEYYYERYLKTQDLSTIMEEYNSLLVNRNRSVRVLDPLGEYEGVAQGINERGELLVERNGKIEKISSGEVSVRGIYGYV